MLRKRSGKADRRAAAPSNAPVNAFEKARVEWFERYGSAIVEKNRYFLLSVIGLAVIIALAFSIMAIAPLKTVVPYVIKVSDNGSVTVDPSAARQNYKPGTAEMQYFLAKWVEKLMTLDTYLTERNLNEAYLQTRANAMSEFTEYMQKEKPIEITRKDATLTKVVKINAVTFLQDGVALVKATTQKRSSNTPAEDKTYLVTIHYAVSPPTTPEMIMQNPLGLFITHFSVVEEM